MSVDHSDVASQRQLRYVSATVEWPTLVVGVAIFGGFVVAVGTCRAIPAPFTIVLLGICSGWYGSLQHEVIHGHPTPWHCFNMTLVCAPLGLFVPYRVYRDEHLRHHDNELLTLPGIDPESRYVSPEEWTEASNVKRAILAGERTLLFALTIGVFRSLFVFWGSMLTRARHERAMRSTLIRHVIGILCVLSVVRLSGLPIWEYIVGAGLGGRVATGLRSFAEHRAAPLGESLATHSAVVHAGRVMSLLFLNNNLHHTHHERPALAWYLIPEVHEEMGSNAIAANGAGLYVGGYAELFRKHLFRSFCQPIHPQMGMTY